MAVKVPLVTKFGMRKETEVRAETSSNHTGRGVSCRLKVGSGLAFAKHVTVLPGCRTDLIGWIVSSLGLSEEEGAVLLGSPDLSHAANSQDNFT